MLPSRANFSRITSCRPSQTAYGKLHVVNARNMQHSSNRCRLLTEATSGAQLQQSQDLWQRVVLLKRQLHRAVHDEDYELAKALLKATQEVEQFLPQEQRELVQHVTALWSGGNAEQLRALEYLWDVLDMQGLPSHLCTSLTAGTQRLVCPGGCRESAANNALDVFAQWLWKPCPVSHPEIQKAMETLNKYDPAVGMRVEKLHLSRLYSTKTNLEAKALARKAKQLAVTTLREEVRQGGTLWRSVQQLMALAVVAGAVVTPLCCADSQEMLDTLGALCSTTLLLLALFTMGFHVWRHAKTRKMGDIWPEPQPKQQQQPGAQA